MRAWRTHKTVDIGARGPSMAAVLALVVSSLAVAAGVAPSAVNAASPPEALVQVTPGGALGATTFGNSTITVSNTGPVDAPQITSVDFDLGGSLIPDATFDPIGTAGDEGTQCLAVSSEGGTGFIAPGDPCVDPFSLPHEDSPGVSGNGWDGMTLDFTGFDSGEAIVFGVDVDPTSIQGVPGSGGSGAVSGLELTGSTVTVTFSDGQVLTNQLFGDGSDGGAEAVVAAAAGVTAPTGIELVGVASTPTVFPNDSEVAVVDAVGPQVVQVSGPVGAAVTLLDADGEMQSPAPFDLDPYESDALVAVDYLTGTIGAGGTLDFAVDIDDASVLHHFVATIDDGANGPVSQKLIVAVDTQAEALVQITPGGALDATTFGNSTITVSNTGPVDAPQITSVDFDLRGSLIPDATFDPVGAAGDAGTQCLEVSSEGGTGYVVPGNNCTDPFTLAHEDSPGVSGNGWDGMTLDFTGFDSGEAIVFGVDVDPTSIQGAAGSGGSGAVSGLELTGSTVTVTFSDGRVLSNQLFGDGSDGGAEAVVAAATGVTAPTGIELVGVASTPTVFPNDSEVAVVDGVGPQVVQVSGPVGAAVTLLDADGEMQSPAPFDLDPYESDALVAVDYLTGTIGAGGTLDFAVDIDDASVLHHFVATIDDGANGPVSQKLIAAVRHAGTGPGRGHSGRWYRREHVQQRHDVHHQQRRCRSGEHRLGFDRSARLHHSRCHVRPQRGGGRHHAEVPGHRGGWCAHRLRDTG